MKSLIVALAACFITQFSFCQNTDSANICFSKGKEANSAKLYAVAAAYFDKAVFFNPNFTEAYIENAKADLSMKMMGKAYENFSKAYQLNPKNKFIIIQLATLSFNNRQFPKAIELAEKCMDCDNASCILGMSYYNQEDYGKAEKYLKEVVSKNCQNPYVFYTLGRTYLELEDEKNAIVQFKKAIELEPKSQWLYELGLICYNQNDYRNAVKYFEMSADQGYHKSNDFYENYGFAQLYSGNSENGIKTLNIILERKPNNKELMNNIAYAMYDTKKYDQALEYFKKVLDINPKDATTLYMAGLTFQQLGQKEKGQKICDNAIELDPSLKMYRQKKELPMGF
jgi:tetratricopeptide (TPR) repeat protein